jgi:arsenate reductase-like glutaredoxin family protein
LLAQNGKSVEERDLLKQPLTLDELRALAKRASGPEQLVAPKRRADADGLTGEKLLAWLAKDGGNVRRPIIEIDGELTVGFSAEAQERLRGLLS